MSPIIHTEHLSKSFKTPHGTIQILKDVNLKVFPGQTISIRGESGAGKSTLLNLMTFLEQPNSGSLHWNGIDPSQQTRRWIAINRAQLIGFVFQSYYLVPELNVIENVLLPVRIRKTLSQQDQQHATTLLSAVQLEHRLHHPSTNLSGGEAQRVAIARALINKPSVIIADEPTGSLDEKTGRTVIELLFSLCEKYKTALVLVTHNTQYAEKATRHAFLSNGILHINEP